MSIVYSMELYKDISFIRKNIFYNYYDDYKDTLNFQPKYLAAKEKSDDEKRQIILQNIFCQSAETSIIKAFYEYLNQNIDKDIQNNEIDGFKSKKKITTSFVPFFNKAYVYYIEDEKFHKKLHQYLKGFNSYLVTKMNCPFYQLKEKKFKTDYKYIDIEMLSKYYAIQKLLTGISLERYNRLLKSLKIPNFILNLDSTISEDNIDLYETLAIEYRRRLYNALLEKSVVEIHRINGE